MKEEEGRDKEGMKDHGEGSKKNEEEEKPISLSLFLSLSLKAHRFLIYVCM